MNGSETSPTSREACDAIIAARKALDQSDDAAFPWSAERDCVYDADGDAVMQSWGHDEPRLIVAAVNAAPILAERMNAVRDLCERKSRNGYEYERGYARAMRDIMAILDAPEPAVMARVAYGDAGLLHACFAAGRDSLRAEIAEKDATIARVTAVARRIREIAGATSARGTNFGDVRGAALNDAANDIEAALAGENPEATR